MGSDEVRLQAARVQQLSNDVRRLATQALIAPVHDWRSTAATAFRERLIEELTAVHAAAAGLEDAAQALRRHAAALDEAAAR